MNCSIMELRHLGYFGVRWQVSVALPTTAPAGPATEALLRMLPGKMVL